MFNYSVHMHTLCLQVMTQFIILHSNNPQRTSSKSKKKTKQDKKVSHSQLHTYTQISKKKNDKLSLSLSTSVYSFFVFFLTTITKQDGDFKTLVNESFMERLYNSSVFLLVFFFANVCKHTKLCLCIHSSK